MLDLKQLYGGQPIMIHRAIFGSIERFFGILVENYAGRPPHPPLGPAGGVRAWLMDGAVARRGTA